MPITNVLDCICNSSETFDIHILIVPEHFCTGVTDQGQLVLIRCLNCFHQGGKGVAAAVGCVFAALDSVYLCDGIFDSTGFQSLVELFPVFLDGHPGSICGAEDGACDFGIGQAGYDGLDLRGDGDGAVLAGFRFGAADKGFPGAVIACYIQLQKFGGAETQITLRNDIIHIGNLANIQTLPSLLTMVFTAPIRWAIGLMESR